MKFVALVYMISHQEWTGFYFTIVAGMLRLALSTILNCKMGSFLAVIALVCSSFVSISAGTHRRAPWDPYGQSQNPNGGNGKPAGWKEPCLSCFLFGLYPNIFSTISLVTYGFETSSNIGWEMGFTSYLEPFISPPTTSTSSMSTSVEWMFWAGPSPYVHARIFTMCFHNLFATCGGCWNGQQFRNPF